MDAITTFVSRCASTLKFDFLWDKTAKTTSSNMPRRRSPSPGYVDHHRKRRHDSRSYDYGYEKRRRNHSRDRSATPDRHVHRHHRDSDSYSPHRNSYHSRHRHHKRRRHRRSYRHHHKSTYSSASSRVGVASGSVHVVIPARSFLRGVMGARES